VEEVIVVEEVSEGAGGMNRYSRYVDEITEDIGEIVQQYGVQPILFVGSGLPKRYFDAPNWEELLENLAANCSLIDKGIGFYKQSLGHPMAIGEEFAKLYQEWAWSTGRNEFPHEMFEPDVGKNDYIKFKAAQHLKGLTPPDLAALGSVDKRGSQAA
jgi:hypothetical protein